MQLLTGFAPLAARYDGFILDLWGVIHDGVAPYPGAVDVLKRLRAAGKPAVLLSNAPRRSAVAQQSHARHGHPGRPLHRHPDQRRGDPPHAARPRRPVFRRPRPAGLPPGAGARPQRDRGA